MFDKLATEEQRYEELMRLLGTREVQSEPQEYRKHAKALAHVEPLIERSGKLVVRHLRGRSFRRFSDAACATSPGKTSRWWRAAGLVGEMRSCSSGSATKRT